MFSSHDGIVCLCRQEVCNWEAILIFIHALIKSDLIPWREWDDIFKLLLLAVRSEP